MHCLRFGQESRQNMLVRRYISEKKLSLDLAADILTCIRQRGLGKARVLSEAMRRFSVLERRKRGCPFWSWYFFRGGLKGKSKGTLTQSENQVVNVRSFTVKG